MNESLLEDEGHKSFCYWRFYYFIICERHGYKKNVAKENLTYHYISRVEALEKTYKVSKKNNESEIAIYPERIKCTDSSFYRTIMTWK